MSAAISAGADLAASAQPQNVEAPDVSAPNRRKLPDERQAITHKFSIGGHEGYITVGMFEDGAPGEIFITMAKEGSTISGLMDSIAVAISLTLQYGVPLKFLVDKFAHVRFEPSGWTGKPPNSLCKVDHGLYFPLAWDQVSRSGIRRLRGRQEFGLTPDRERRAAAPSVPAGHTRRSTVRRVRLDHDEKRQLLQVRELRRRHRLQLAFASFSGMVQRWMSWPSR
jgi:hypothetical protein